MKTILVSIYRGRRLVTTRDCEFLSIQHSTARIRDYATDEDIIGLYDIKTGQRSRGRRGYTYVVDPNSLVSFLPAFRQAARNKPPKAKAVYYTYRVTLSTGKVVTFRATRKEQAVAKARRKTGGEPRSVTQVNPLAPRFSL